MTNTQTPKNIIWEHSTFSEVRSDVPTSPRLVVSKHIPLQKPPSRKLALPNKKGVLNHRDRRFAYDASVLFSENGPDDKSIYDKANLEKRYYESAQKTNQGIEFVPAIMDIDPVILKQAHLQGHISTNNQISAECIDCTEVPKIKGSEQSSFTIADDIGIHAPWYDPAIERSTVGRAVRKEISKIPYEGRALKEGSSTVLPSSWTLSFDNEQPVLKPSGPPTKSFFVVEPVSRHKKLLKQQQKKSEEKEAESSLVSTAEPPLTDVASPLLQEMSSCGSKATQENCVEKTCIREGGLVLTPLTEARVEATESTLVGKNECTTSMSNKKEMSIIQLSDINNTKAPSSDESKSCGAGNRRNLIYKDQLLPSTMDIMARVDHIVPCVLTEVEIDKAVAVCGDVNGHSRDFAKKYYMTKEMCNREDRFRWNRMKDNASDLFDRVTPIKVKLPSSSLTNSAVHVVTDKPAMNAFDTEGKRLADAEWRLQRHHAFMPMNSASVEISRRVAMKAYGCIQSPKEMKLGNLSSNIRFGDEPQERITYRESPVRVHYPMAQPMTARERKIQHMRSYIL